MRPRSSPVAMRGGHEPRPWSQTPAAADSKVSGTLHNHLVSLFSSLSSGDKKCFPHRIILTIK